MDCMGNAGVAALRDKDADPRNTALRRSATDIVGVTDKDHTREIRRRTGPKTSDERNAETTLIKKRC